MYTSRPRRATWGAMSATMPIGVSSANHSKIRMHTFWTCLSAPKSDAPERRSLTTIPAPKMPAKMITPSVSFAALSANDTLGVIIFAGIFGAGMVVSERRSGASLFGALKHVQNVCILIFEWFALLTPIGIVALIAPQVALLGRDVYIVLAPFAYAFITASVLL